MRLNTLKDARGKEYGMGESLDVDEMNRLTAEVNLILSSSRRLLHKFIIYRSMKRRNGRILFDCVRVAKLIFGRPYGGIHSTSGSYIGARHILPMDLGLKQWKNVTSNVDDSNWAKMWHHGKVKVEDDRLILLFGWDILQCLPQHSITAIRVNIQGEQLMPLDVSHMFPEVRVPDEPEVDELSGEPEDDNNWFVERIVPERNLIFIERNEFKPEVHLPGKNAAADIVIRPIGFTIGISNCLTE